MNRKTEKEIILYYLDNLLKTPLGGDQEDRVCTWFEENARDLIGKDIEDLWEARRRHWNRKPDGEEQPLPRTSRMVKKMLEGQSGRMVFTSEISAIIDAFHRKRLDAGLDLGADAEAKDAYGRLVCMNAFIGSSFETVRYLIEMGIDLDVRDGSDHTLLHYAATNSDIRVLKHWVKLGFDPFTATIGQFTIPFE